MQEKNVLLSANHLKKIYHARGGTQVTALSDVTFDVAPGEFVAIMGESGSGKTTLLNIIAGLDTPTAGQVTLDGADLSDTPERELAVYRRENLGFVFQEFNLLDTFSLRDNILLPLVLQGVGVDEMQKCLPRAIAFLGIDDVLDKYPWEVSGGQKQRAAVARALITEPKLILADEPTGALDSASTADLLSVFEKINADGQTIVMVTHSVDAAAHASRVLFIRDGRVYHEIRRGDATHEQTYKIISDTLTSLRRGTAANEADV